MQRLLGNSGFELDIDRISDWHLYKMDFYIYNFIICYFRGMIAMAI